MWDAPEPQDRNFNRFARREITKATRAAEYWASEHDEYALPGMSGTSTGFQSARAGMPRPRDRDRDRDREPTSPAKPPPKPIKSRHVDIPAPLPFTFGRPDPKKSEAGLGSFTNASNSFLSNLDSLGVGPIDEGEGSSPFASPSLGGSPNLFAGDRLPTPAGLPGGGRVELAKGKKRLGMGRPAPWGAKR
jgi:DNA helicase-2/ATP-dependent DNA helicase PcrA